VLPHHFNLVNNALDLQDYMLSHAVYSPEEVNKVS